MGHVKRTTEMKIPARILGYNSEERRGVGRPNVRRSDGVREDLRKFGVKNWRRVQKIRRLEKDPEGSLGPN